MGEEPQSQPTVGQAHRFRRMVGRDPHEPNRAATPLELLFDLTFVVAFGIAAAQFAHMLAAGQVATGLAAYYIEHRSELGSVATVLTVVIPVGVYILMVYLLYAVMTRTIPVFHVLLLAGSAALLGLAVVLAARGISMANCLLVVTLAPVVSVVGYEVRGHRYAAQAVRNLRSS
ncbi:MAG: hypothetical protein ACPGXI_10010 [Mycobacterium sp.]